jgi:large subunit ribosomal protein L13
MKTYIPKIADLNQNRKWFLIDLNGAVLGKAAIEVANILRGKNKPIFTPHIDTGDYVIAINASQVKISGNKANDKKYFRYSGYPGGLRSKNYEKMMVNDSDRVFIHAVRGMLPKNKLGRKMLKKLHVYSESDHSHNAQKPEVLNLFESK